MEVGDIWDGLENHKLVTEEAGGPEQSRRRLQRAYTRSHHAKASALPQLGLIFPATCVCLRSPKKKRKNYDYKARKQNPKIMPKTKYATKSEENKRKVYAMGK